MDIEIPDKTYFRIGEVSKILGVEPYVVRYWETEFKTVKPIRTKSEQRLYRQKDLEELALIRNLLYRDRFTIAGAKKKTPGTSKESPSFLRADGECREKLRSIKTGVESHPGSVELNRNETKKSRSVRETSLRTGFFYLCNRVQAALPAEPVLFLCGSLGSLEGVDLLRLPL